MATAGVPLWSTTAANNATADPAVSMPEGMAPSAVNDGVRALMASAAKWRDDLYGITTGGSATAFTITTGSTFASASDMSGAIFTIIPHTTSGAAPTLAVDGLTARQLRSATGVNVVTGALVAGTPYLVKYVHATTEFIVFNLSAAFPWTSVYLLGATDLTGLANDDIMPIYDLSATTNKRCTVQALLNILGGLSAITTPDETADSMLIYDASAAGARRMLLQYLPAHLPRGYIDGCIMSNASGDPTNDIDFAAGVCRDSTNAFDITCAAMAGKQLDANWAAGANAGMRTTAGIANQTYHIFAVAKADGTQDYYAHESPTEATALADMVAETSDSDWVYARRIGSIIRSSAAILAFIQHGDDFTLSIPVEDMGLSSSLGTTRTARTLTVPTGVKVQAKLRVLAENATGATQDALFLITDLAQADTAPTTSYFTIWAHDTGSAADYETCVVDVWTNTSAQIGYRGSTSSAYQLMQWNTLGWKDLRGKDA